MLRQIASREMLYKVTACCATWDGVWQAKQQHGTDRHGTDMLRASSLASVDNRK